jgi:ribosomal protein S18 acetylase RimI-like enzyme
VEFKVRRLKSEETEAALALAWRTFLEFEAPEYSPEGVDTFRQDIMESESFRALCLSGEHRLWGAFDGEKLVGMMGMWNTSHICLVFTDKAYHRRGVATAIRNAESMSPEVLQMLIDRFNRNNGTRWDRNDWIYAFRSGQTVPHRKAPR